MRLLITAGPTREPIDAVRFISNRSSGQVGIRLAEAAVAAGHEVTLLLGPVLRVPTGAVADRVVAFESAADLKALLDLHFSAADVLIMAAAVADYRPVERVAGKLPRGHAGEGRILRLEPTEDLVAAMARQKRPDQRVIAFALEEPDLLEQRAREKLQRKRVDAIVANPLQTMDAETIEPSFITAAGRSFVGGQMSKQAFGPWLLEQMAGLWPAGN